VPVNGPSRHQYVLHALYWVSRGDRKHWRQHSRVTLGLQSRLYPRDRVRGVGGTRCEKGAGRKGGMCRNSTDPFEAKQEINDRGDSVRSSLDCYFSNKERRSRHGKVLLVRKRGVRQNKEWGDLFKRGQTSVSWINEKRGFWFEEKLKNQGKITEKKIESSKKRTPPHRCVKRKH